MIEPVNSRRTSGASVRVERVDVERDDGRVALGKARDQRMADLAARPGHEDDRFSHRFMIVRAVLVNSVSGS